MSRRTSRLLQASLVIAVTFVAISLFMTPADVKARIPALSSIHGVDTTATDPRFGVTEASTKPNLADQLGARWSRIPFIWSYVQASGPTSWNSFVLSSHGSNFVINDEIARGRSIVGMLLGTPSWARQNSSWGEASVPRNIDKAWNDPQNYWGAYCYRLAKEFTGRINDWIVWNEVSIPPSAGGSLGLWTQWRGTPEQYARVLQIAYQAVHAANPQARIIMYGDPYWYDHGTYLTNLYNILAKMDPSNHFHGYFDVANLHLYINAPSFYWIITDLRKKLQSHGWGAKQIWISETNVEPYDDPTHPATHKNFRVSMQSQASFLVDAFATYLTARADRIEIYRMYDGPETAHGLAAWGLVNNSGKERPIARTFHFIVSLFKGAKGGSFTSGEFYNDPGIGGKSGVFKAVTYKPGQRITVLWNQAGAQATYTRPFRKASGITYDAHGLIVMPMMSPRGISYDRNGTATYALQAHASLATVYDKFGTASVVKPVHGTYSFKLKGGTEYTNPADPRIPTVGGDPVIVVEPQ